MRSKDNRISLRYKSLLFLLSPAILGYIIYRALKDGGCKYFCQRLGFNYPSMPSNPILIHCASVGEVNAAKPLFLKLCEQYPDKNIVISTNTPTAAQLVTKLQNQNISHVYLPLDYSILVNAFLKRITPKCVLILETEIWPNLFSLAANRNIPIAIINGRLTEKSIKANKIIKNDYANALNNLSMLLARSDEDKSLFIRFGAKEMSARTVGNLKYARVSSSSSNLACTTIKRPFVLAVSTHDDEEMQLAQHINILRKKNYLLVIAPRYPDRSEQLQRQLQSDGIQTTLRSNSTSTADNSEIYIIDTLGELDMYFNEAALVFVGGSLIQKGGHNVLEPASYGKCIIVGPHTDNFALEVKELAEVNGIVQASSIHDLGVKMVQLLNDDRDRAQYGHNAQKFIAQKSTVLSDYLNLLETII